MVVGIGKISLHLSGNRSLKDKRSVIRRAIDRTTGRFNVAFAEVGAQNTHDRSLLGMAVVSGDRRHANAMLDRIFEFVERNVEARVEQRSMEFFDVGVPVADRELMWEDFE